MDGEPRRGPATSAATGRCVERRRITTKEARAPGHPQPHFAKKQTERQQALRPVQDTSESDRKKNEPIPAKRPKKALRATYDGRTTMR